MDFSIDDTVLFWSGGFGLGDLIMARLLWEDFQDQFGHHDLVWAIPQRWFPVVQDHPYRPPLVDLNEIMIEQYQVKYNIGVIFGMWGNQHFSCHSNIHPADHAAMRCGVTLRPDARCHFRLSQTEVDFGRTLVEGFSSPVVAICPRTSTPTRDLSQEQLEGVVRGVRRRGYQPIVVHSEPIPVPTQVPLFGDLTIRQLMGLYSACSAVISTETSHNHLAGGLHRQVLALYSFCDGHTYNTYYPRSVVRQEHEGIEPNPHMNTMSVKMILDGFDELKGAYDDDD